MNHLIWLICIYRKSICEKENYQFSLKFAPFKLCFPYSLQVYLVLENRMSNWNSNLFVSINDLPWNVCIMQRCKEIQIQLFFSYAK